MPISGYRLLSDELFEVVRRIEELGDVCLPSSATKQRLKKSGKSLAGETFRSLGIAEEA